MILIAAGPTCEIADRLPLAIACRLLCVCALALPASCDQVFSYGATRQDAAAVDSADQVDGSAPVDTSAGEEPAGPADSQPPEDLPKDVSPIEASHSDLVVPDGLSPLEACAAPASPTAWLPNMVICRRSAGVTLCVAESLCAAGWHLCTASEYLARGGDNGGPPDDGSHWLAACVRVGNSVSAPDTGAVCPGSCVMSQQDMLPVSWSCAGGTELRSRWTPMGVTTATSCNRVGENSAAWGGYWDHENASIGAQGALCCK